jgi:hypothetical protein
MHAASHHPALHPSAAAAAGPRPLSPAAASGRAQQQGPGPLVVVGSINADLVLAVDRVPAPGETLGARSLSFYPGGKGANQAAAAARLGFPTYFVGATGTDAYAPPLRAALAGCGVRLEHVRETEGPSGTAVILLQPSGGALGAAAAGPGMRACRTPGEESRWPGIGGASLRQGRTQGLARADRAGVAQMAPVLGTAS